MSDSDADTDLLTPAEVGKLFRVGPKTVSRWARQGRIAAIKTMGGHRRFRRADVEAVLREVETPARSTADG